MGNILPINSGGDKVEMKSTFGGTPSYNYFVSGGTINFGKVVTIKELDYGVDTNGATINSYKMNYVDENGISKTNVSSPFRQGKNENLNFKCSSLSLQVSTSKTNGGRSYFSVLYV